MGEQRSLGKAGGARRQDVAGRGVDADRPPDGRGVARFDDGLHALGRDDDLAPGKATGQHTVGKDDLRVDDVERDFVARRVDGRRQRAQPPDLPERTSSGHNDCR